jgi:hypothetical protein
VAAEGERHARGYWANWLLSGIMLDGHEGVYDTPYELMTSSYAFCELYPDFGINDLWNFYTILSKNDESITGYD